MKVPGAEHPISIAHKKQRVRVLAGDTVVADTSQALALREAGYAEVLYIPRTDADMMHLTKTARVTHCPYKGDASYYTIIAGGRTFENAVWSYETPYPAMAQIAGCLAFYPSKVNIELSP